VLKDLREGQGKIAELRERLVAAEDLLKRVDIRAPDTGVVLQLSVHTVGGVVVNGETIMQIVPNNDSLVVEAKVAPQDIDQIVAGAKAVVRIMAGNQRTTPDLDGVLLRVSADLAHDQPAGGQPGQPYYQVRVSLPRSDRTPRRHAPRPRHAGGSLHPDLSQNTAAISAQAAARPDHADLPGTVRPARCPAGGWIDAIIRASVSRGFRSWCGRAEAGQP
jgi:hypothetical protein